MQLNFLYDLGIAVDTTCLSLINQWRVVVDEPDSVRPASGEGSFLEEDAAGILQGIGEE